LPIPSCPFVEITRSHIDRAGYGALVVAVPVLVETTARSRIDRADRRRGTWRRVGATGSRDHREVSHRLCPSRARPISMSPTCRDHREVSHRSCREVGCT